MATLKRLVLPIVVAAIAGGGYYRYSQLPPTPLVLTGIVTTNDVVVSPQIAGRIYQLNVDEGDQVKAGDMIAVLEPG